ncbi:putative sugar nucleotidyl transferase [Solitalea koreensis]|uniref:UDP-N-acetylglucosamine diphosphorylase/glucosamine-1-phosphate N-acetyltransferase n=1 Tax=Solitalea koreensis TaxID=543615 RepID=A0A521DPU8_9SPHI|nr:putative sugar nucleotidyl transferase [Solitalea koreensis]SMO73713.1 UDP-N-acetylglucosamine diphosphorylase/glucosamine-1-phosphate N-acetyltransferase [Solitalea koreensis]
MLNLILFDDIAWQQLRPLTFTRPVSHIRIGILTIKEKWERHLSGEVSCLTQPYLSAKFKLKTDESNLLINSSIVPTEPFVSKVLSLTANQALVSGTKLLAIRLDEDQLKTFNPEQIPLNAEPYRDELILIQQPSDIFTFNHQALRSDFELLTKNRISEKLNDTNTVLGNQLFVEEGIEVNCAIINTTTGPVYIGKNVQIMEGAMIRGPFAACEGSVVKMGTKIYGSTTLGPNTVVGGEVKNSVIFGNSNKGHEGYLGDSVIAEWCNLGADTNNSNLKNNFGEVKVWDYSLADFKPSGLQKIGLIMGDHSKCAINTSFNTGTVVGVGCNIAGSGLLPKFIPDFLWFTTENRIDYRLEKAFHDFDSMMNSKKSMLNAEEKRILEEVFNLTNTNRK